MKDVESAHPVGFIRLTMSLSQDSSRWIRENRGDSSTTVKRLSHLAIPFDGLTPHFINDLRSIPLFLITAQFPTITKNLDIVSNTISLPGNLVAKSENNHLTCFSAKY
jgi:hypothetical protein